MNKDEFGIAFYLNMAYTMAGFTTLSLAFTRPDGTVLTVTSPSVNINASPLVTPSSGTFAANQYAQYTFAAGDINQAGVYSARLTYQAAGIKLISDIVQFTVNP